MKSERYVYFVGVTGINVFDMRYMIYNVCYNSEIFSMRFIYLFVESSSSDRIKVNIQLIHTRKRRKRNDRGY